MDGSHAHFFAPTMKSIYRWVGVISVLALSAALGPACAPDASGGGSGIAGEDDIAAASKTGGGLVIVRLYEDAIRTRGIIDEAEAVRLSAFLKGTEQDDARRVLQSIVDDASAALAPEARAVLKSALAGEVKGDVPLDNPIYRVELGSNPAFVLDDQLFFAKRWHGRQSNRYYWSQSWLCQTCRWRAASRAWIAFPGSKPYRRQRR